MGFGDEHPIILQQRRNQGRNLMNIGNVRKHVAAVTKFLFLFPVLADGLVIEIALRVLMFRLFATSAACDGSIPSTLYPAFQRAQQRPVV